MLHGSGFPLHDIKRAQARSGQPRQHQLGQKRTQPKATVYLPFRSDGLDRKVRRLIRRSKIPFRVVYTQGKSLKQTLVRSALLPKSRKCEVHQRFVEQQNQRKKSRGKPRDDCISCKVGVDERFCDREGAVYSLKCKLCSEEYVGETQRAIRTRIGEHHMQARNRTAETPWGDHMRKHHPGENINKEPIFSAKVLATVTNSSKRKTREAIEIRDRQPSINRSKGWRT